MSLLVSIITVCYNSERTIERTIKSVLSQRYKNIEYIIVDGKSTDSTLSIIEKYRAKLEDRCIFKLISEPDNGIYDAMNKGIKQCTGEIIGIINSDDWYEDDAIENIIDAYPDDGKLFIIYGMMSVLDEKEIEHSTYINRHENLEEVMINHPTCFVSKSVYDLIGLFDLQYKSSSDYDFMLRCFYNPEVVFHPVYRIIANFSLGGISGTSVGEIETLKIKHKYGIINSKTYILGLIKKYIKRIFD